MYEQRAKWYVYELINPIDGNPFYIGKGCGNRMNSHEREAKKGSFSKKTQIINNIWDSGLDVSKRVIAVFWCEKAAYKLERELITSDKDLANIANGGGTPRRLNIQQKCQRYGTKWAAADLLLTVLKCAPEMATPELRRRKNQILAYWLKNTGALQA